MTPVQRVGDVWLKRDDLFDFDGSRGGKVRACLQIVTDAMENGTVLGLVTAGSRQSPQANIVATIAARYGLPCRAHVPAGDETPEMRAATARGATLVPHRPGYNTVIVSRAATDATESGWLEIPFGMEHPAIVQATAAQVANLPDDVQRIVVPVGSGMALSGILHGLLATGRHIPVLGVQVGADPTKRLAKYAPKGWRDMATIVQSDLDYHTHAPITVIGGVRLDPVYEAKALPFLQPGDLLWIVGRRESVHDAGH